MPTASITMPSGATIVIEGSQSEVVDLIARFQCENVPQQPKRGPRPNQGAGVHRTGPLDLLLELIEGGFFKTPKDLGSVKSALEERGHFYPTTTLSPLMLRLVRRKTLRRIKENKRWTYVS